MKIGYVHTEERLKTLLVSCFLHLLLRGNQYSLLRILIFIKCLQIGDDEEYFIKLEVVIVGCIKIMMELGAGWDGRDDSLIRRSGMFIEV